MNYTLSEEQSTEFYAKLIEIRDFAKGLSEEGVELARIYYGLYECEAERHWFWKTKSFDWFLKTIGNDAGYRYVKASDSRLGYEFLSTRNNSGWVFKTKAKRISKLTGLDENVVNEDCNNIQRSAWYMFANYQFLCKLDSYISDMESFMTVPYTLDDNWMSTYKFLDEHMKHWKIGA